MEYSNDDVIGAFKIYSTLARNGYADKEDLRAFLAEEHIGALVEQFAREVDCTIFKSGEYIYMIPLAVDSPFHISNESIKRNHLPNRANNLDIYLMYFSIIVLFGEFYDSYQTREATRDFLSISSWLDSINERIESLKGHDPEKLKSICKEQEYNWVAIMEKWEAMDDINEKVKVQDARTISRKSFLNIVKQFLIDQKLIEDIGNDEITLTEKAKVIIQKYYMEVDYNRGILEFIYSIEKDKERELDASHI